MENAALMEWADPTVTDQRKRMRRTAVLSLCAHLAVLSGAYFVPPPTPRAMPPAISIALLAALPMAALPEPAAKPATPPRPAPAQKVKILPKNAPSAEARPRVKPKPAPVKRREKPKELKIDDAMAQLRAQLGEEAPPSEAELAQARAEEQAFDELLAESRAQSQGAKIAPELAKWHGNVKRHLRASWITPPEFRRAGLMTELAVEIARDGRVLGIPEVVRSSGNPHYDDNTVRAVLSASPLPPPPTPGRRIIIFRPEE